MRVRALGKRLSLHSLRCPRHFSTDTKELVRDRLLATQLWLDRVVIGERLCPFAPPVRAAPRLKLRASTAVNASEVIEEVAEEAAILSDGIRRGSAAGLPETTLLVLDGKLQPFVRDWRDLVRLSWKLQADAIAGRGFEEEIQLVLFHPLAMHSAYGESGPEEDPADFTIRAPFPTVHLLRECDVLSAVESYPDAAQIPSRNKVRLRAQGLDMCSARLASCMSGAVLET
eukprot:gnl/TRDRNA2_/TRDRNA2_82258_c0_seq1.p1 gnl/TRDRNA2_/TRDRNA2_82258_c0~~gnl/TRDRNA2_/TRDRNA2_82258_c0_seq1.p1  ORF type:complete len:229 (+),score=27.87 gnl/TRDRNA2_/TRDRNA2_82258_c0_seq1:55-741(+)